VATEAAWLNGNNLKKETTKKRKNKRKDLTLTGLLMEGVDSLADSNYQSGSSEKLCGVVSTAMVGESV
jgi:hypothetical protein